MNNTVYRCVNCETIYDADPQGHCSKCSIAGRGNYSCVPFSAITLLVALSDEIISLKKQMQNLDHRTIGDVRLGPSRQNQEESDKQRDSIFKKLTENLIKPEPPPVDRSKQELASGQPVPEDRSHTKLRANGQQEDYIILSPEERAKGYVRPVRKKYEHVGPPPPKHPLRDLTQEEKERWGNSGFVQFEVYPEAMKGTGRFWTQKELDKIGKGCGTVTKMSQSIAETYARDPRFYGGTFCCGCNTHFPVGEHGEFVWEGTTERVGT